MKKNTHFVFLFAFLAIFLGFVVFILFSHFLPGPAKPPATPTAASFDTPAGLQELPVVTAPPTALDKTEPPEIDNALPGDAATESPALQNGATFAPTSNYVRPIGRTVLQNGVRWFSLSGCGVEFQSGGDSVILTLITANSDTVVSHHRPRVGVFVDGVLTNDLILENETTAVSVALGGAETRTVKLIKLSESMHSCVGLAGVTCVESVTPSPTAEKLRIEFIGDSITAGYGLDEPNANAAFSTRTQNFSETYAYLSATALGADCWGVAYSGYGVVSGFSANASLKADAVLSRCYDKALTNCTNVDDAAATWSFAENQPHYIVINLGTNDANNYCCTEARCQEFVAKYQELLSMVRSRNPGAFIFCVLGDMNDKLYPYIVQAVQAYSASTGDAGVTYAPLKFYMDIYPPAIAGHPSKESNFVAAQELVEILWKKMNGQ
ncbi:MAG: hypothetical protein IKN72_12325 [Clostridia bacterium]|nr:hypothetical protein [Clostridia bacterium]